MRDQVDALYRREARRVFATLVRLIGDLDLAEDALQEAFNAALKQWPHEGVPANPFAWLVSAGRFKAIDHIRRAGRLEEIRQALHEQHHQVEVFDAECDAVQDDRLRLIFTCCHPALADPVKVALTLREVCGLSTEAIANAFLVTTSTMAQRLVRGKSKIKTAGIPYEVPSQAQLAERLEAVLTVIYLIFNEGYHPSTGDPSTNEHLSQEAIRLGRLLTALLPDPEVLGLLALMLLQESRRGARISSAGEWVLLQDQDRTLWDERLIEEAQALLDQAFAGGEVGSFTLEAAIAAVHAEAKSAEQTDWPQIVGLYDLLLQASPSPVVELNRAVAVAMRDGPESGLVLIDQLQARGELNNYHLLPAARADLLRRLARLDQAREAYQHAITLANQEADRRFLEARLSQLK